MWNRKSREEKVEEKLRRKITRIMKKGSLTKKEIREREKKKERERKRDVKSLDWMNDK